MSHTNTNISKAQPCSKMNLDMEKGIVSGHSPFFQIEFQLTYVEKGIQKYMHAVSIIKPCFVGSYIQVMLAMLVAKYGNSLKVKNQFIRFRYEGGISWYIITGSIVRPVRSWVFSAILSEALQFFYPEFCFGWLYFGVGNSKGCFHTST